MTFRMFFAPSTLHSLTRIILLIMNTPKHQSKIFWISSRLLFFFLLLKTFNCSHQHQSAMSNKRRNNHCHPLPLWAHKFKSYIQWEILFNYPQVFFAVSYNEKMFYSPSSLCPGFNSPSHTLEMCASRMQRDANNKQKETWS